MMRSLQQLFLFSGVLSMLLLLTGLFKPWMVLWWRPGPNRRKVVKLYGTLMVLSAAVYLALAVLTQIP